MRPVTAALAALALSAPAASHAQPVSTPAGAGPDTYLELHVGAFLPRHHDIDALDPGYDVGGTFGARFNPYLSIEGEVGYLHATGSEPAIDAGIAQRLSIVPVTASVRLRLASRSAEISVLGGAGVYIASLLSTKTRIGPGGPEAIEVSEDSTDFGYHVGAALALNLSPTMLVGAEVRRTFLDGSFGTLGDVGLDGVRVALTLGYHF